MFFSLNRAVSWTDSGRTNDSGKCKPYCKVIKANFIVRRPPLFVCVCVRERVPTETTTVTLI